jgi:anti-sigma factor RsiW
MKMQNCSQTENLVAYLYGEASEAEKKDFEKHLSSCALCSEELAAFGIVRESVAEWRDDVLNNIVTPAFAKNTFAKQERKRSALVAIREFFTLSPLWLRGATAFAALALIALLTFAAVRLIGDKGNKEIANKNKNEIVSPSPEGR